MFIKDEIAGKKAKIRALLAELDLDGILVKRIANFAWLTGGGINYVGLTSEIGICPILITPDAEYVISNAIEHPRLRDEELLEEQGYTLRSYPWHNDAGEAEAVAGIMKGGRLGSDCGHPGSTDVSGRLNELRWALTGWEVARYRSLGRASATAIEETCKTIRPGDTEAAVIGRLMERLWAERMDYITTFCAADDRISRFRHPVTTERKIEKRAMLCVNSRKNGLIISLTRFVHFGPVPADLKRIYRDNVRIDCILMANSVPGRPFTEPFLKGIQAYKDLGYPAEPELHHQGGPIGYVGREMRVHWGTKGTIAENQAFAWNPSITGSKSEDVCLAASSGPEILSPPVIFPTIEMEAEGRKFVRPDMLEM